MNKQKWILDGNSGLFYPIPSSTVLHLTPGPGIFKIAMGNNPNDKRLGLLRVQDGDKFTFPGKFYSLGNEDFINKVLGCWNSKEFVNAGKNLAVGLTGYKGAGKTYMAKDLSNRVELPILILDNDFDGAVVDFITSLEFECVILIDEAEKIFNRNLNNSHILLRILDGINNSSRKLYILTTNILNIDDNFLGRPGRLRYIKSFVSLPPNTVKEIIEDELIDKSKTDEIKEIINSLTISTIDIVRSIIEEVNIFGDIDVNTFNLPIAPYIYKIISFGETLTANDISKVKEAMEKAIPNNTLSVYTWLCDENNRENLVKELSDMGLSSIDCENDVFPYSMTTTCPKLYQGLETNVGMIQSEVDENGFFLLRDKYHDMDTYLCKIVQEIGSNKLYNNLLI